MRTFAIGELEVRGSGHSWAVYSGSERLSRFYPAQPAALLAATRLELASKRRMRPCLCCQETFESEGPHNRMCANCRRNAQEVA